MRTLLALATLESLDAAHATQDAAADTLRMLNAAHDAPPSTVRSPESPYSPRVASLAWCEEDGVLSVYPVTLRTVSS